jgi:hypothetical protein
MACNMSVVPWDLLSGIPQEKSVTKRPRKSIHYYYLLFIIIPEKM